MKPQKTSKSKKPDDRFANLFEIRLIEQAADSLSEWIKKPDPDSFRAFIEWKKEFERLVNNNSFNQTMRELQKHNQQYYDQLIDRLIPAIMFNLGTMAKEYKNRDDLFSYISASGLVKLGQLSVEPKLEPESDGFFQKIRTAKHNAFKAENILRKVVNELNQKLTEASNTQLAELTDTENNIIEALGEGNLRGPELLMKAGYNNSSHYRNVLSNLVKRGILGRNNKGYYKKRVKEVRTNHIFVSD